MKITDGTVHISVALPFPNIARFYLRKPLGGTFTTKPIVFKKKPLHQLFHQRSRSVMGIIDESGWPMSFYTPEDCDVIYGDELEKEVSWRGSLTFHLYGKTIRLNLSLLMRMLFIADKIRQARTEPEAERGIGMEYVNIRFYISKLTLGTVQFGMDYGIANIKGKPDRNESCI